MTDHWLMSEIIYLGLIAAGLVAGGVAYFLRGVPPKYRGEHR
jgi:hypothetical protein